MVMMEGSGDPEWQRCRRRRGRRSAKCSRARSFGLYCL